MNTSTTAATPTVVKIKKELPSDEIKEFAENTMNELLGWYGFDSVDRLDLSAKTSKILQTAPLISGQQQHHHHQIHHLEKRRSRASRAASLLQMHQQQQQNDRLRTLSNNNNTTTNNNNNISSHNNNSININNSSSINCNSNSYRGNDSTNSDHDTRSSRDDDSKSPNSAGRTHSTAANVADEKLVDYENCCWCRRPVPENAPEFLTTSDGPRYCSESCFTQSRRASFKKAKTCDWCKHVRHAVSYVDFQDGASQLQFCSDKCLNQYKMQIFCKETQAHLDMNPHLKEQGLEAVENGANLITPDLWLRNCRSRSASPTSTVSISPGPTSQANLNANTASPPPKLTLASNTSHKPLISVAPVSKLMSKSPNMLTAGQSPKPNRKKRPVRSCAAAEIVNAHSHESKTNCSTSLVAAAAGSKQKPLMAALNENTRCTLNQSNTQTLTQFAASCVQDLHMNVPPLSPMLDTPSSQPTTPLSLPATPNRINNTTTMPPSFFATPPNSQGPQSSPSVGITTQGFNSRAGFFPNPNAGFVPRFMGNFAGLPPPFSQAPVANLMPPDLTALNALLGTPQPVTIMVPYPVIIPLPIPIPVPLPIVDFYKAHLTPAERKKYEEAERIKKETSRAEVNAEQPLDFTKTKETETEQNETIDKKLTAESIKQSDLESSLRKNSKEKANSPTSEDSQSTIKSLHCLLTNEENKNNNNEGANAEITENCRFVTNSRENINEDSNEVLNSNLVGETNQKLPKLKITRLQTKRALIQTKESECSRPLRKRKRIIDCDFQKLSNSTSSNKETNDIDDELSHTTTENDVTNKGQNNNKK